MSIKTPVSTTDGLIRLDLMDVDGNIICTSEQVREIAAKLNLWGELAKELKYACGYFDQEHHPDHPDCVRQQALLSRVDKIEKGEGT